MATRRNDKARLLATARRLAAQLKLSDHGTVMRIRLPSGVSKPQTDGWRAVIGSLGGLQPHLELWLDRFSGFGRRKFFACYFSENRGKMLKITRRVSRQLWPVRTITVKDTTTSEYFALSKRLSSSLLAKPILEKYNGETFFGIYDPSSRTSNTADTHFCNRAAAFFLQVAESLPKAKGRAIQRTDFPGCENRKLVKAHLQRERSSYLAVQCKERDHYRCQVCRMTFVGDYGKELGALFAEAHHVKPLGKQGDKVRTDPKDLITVCANCHRMLHRMDGNPGDVGKLRAIVRKHRK
jgi:hypothetical protein